MSQKDLSKKLGVSQNQISKWESGRNDFKIGTLIELSMKLGLNLLNFDLEENKDTQIARSL